MEERSMKKFILLLITAVIGAPAFAGGERTGRRKTAVTAAGLLHRVGVKSGEAPTPTGLASQAAKTIDEDPKAAKIKFIQVLFNQTGDAHFETLKKALLHIMRLVDEGQSTFDKYELDQERAYWQTVAGFLSKAHNAAKAKSPKTAQEYAEYQKALLALLEPALIDQFGGYDAISGMGADQINNIWQTIIRENWHTNLFGPQADWLDTLTLILDPISLAAYAKTIKPTQRAELYREEAARESARESAIATRRDTLRRIGRDSIHNIKDWVDEVIAKRVDTETGLPAWATEWIKETQELREQAPALPEREEEESGRPKAEWSAGLATYDKPKLPPRGK